MSQQAPKSFTIPFFTFILVLLSIGMYLTVSIFLEPTHDTQRWPILSIMILTIMMGIAIVLPALIVEIQSLQEIKI